jgi:hypothetical protein
MTRGAASALMSALGQKATCAPQTAMAALPPKADMCGATAHVCYGPKAEIAGGEPAEGPLLGARKPTLSFYPKLTG